MNKGELVDKIAKEQDITKKQAADTIDLMMDTIIKSVKKGHEVRLVGFGTFYRKKRKARMGVNPQTGSKMKIAAKKVPKFRAGNSFKKAVA
mgnify:CR=1 FL=1